MTQVNDADEVEVVETETESTDYKAKYTELGIRTRERTKTLKDQLAARDAEIAEFKKATKSEVKEVKTEFGLLEKAFLKASGFQDPDEVEVLKKWQKDTGKGIDELVEHPFIKTEIANLRTSKANALATQGLRTEGRTTAKTIDEYLADGTLPESKAERRKVLAEKLRRAKDGSAGGKFYDD